MLRYLYRFALPGGRRVIIAYFPPKPEERIVHVPLKQTELLRYDRIFAQAGLYSGGLEPRWTTSRSKHEGSRPSGKRTQ